MPFNDPFKVSIPKVKENTIGEVGYDNPRENIDPHQKTKAIETKEINTQKGNISETPSVGDSITNKTYVDSQISGENHWDMTGNYVETYVDNKTISGAGLAISGSTFTVDKSTGTTTITSADINAGNIDGTTIGASSKAAGSFTTVTTTGNVGIGTSPSYLLEVAGQADNNWIAQIQNTEATDGRNYGFRVRGGSTSADKAFAVEDHDGANSLFSIGGDGKVGIGTTSPDGPLNIEVAADNTHSYFDTYSTSLTQMARLNLRKSKNATAGTVSETIDGDVLGVVDFQGVDAGNTWRIGGRIKGIQDGAASASKIPVRLDFLTENDGESLATRMSITPAGNVGIGTISPNGTLNVYSGEAGSVDPHTSADD
ncbi:hypothetical protein CMI41_03625, partial [Candidatus Pacearchaeota archaeon]|nr:hypothetical protein [Candidatus Pacearchaeota archaeon]